MKNIILTIILIASVILTGCVQKKKFNYPVTNKTDHVDEYFGIEVPDPYRWLEDDNSEETAEWVKAENEITFAYLNSIPFRDKLEERLTELWDYPKVSSPFKEGGRYYLSRNDGLQDQDVMYVKETLDGKETMILDPNTLSEDGTVAMTMFEPSPDGKYIGYGISRGGSDWNEFYVMDAAGGKLLEDHLKWIKFSSMAWYKDGFYYSRYPEVAEGDELSGVNEYNKVYYHKISKDQSADKLIFEDPDHPVRSFVPIVSNDKKILMLYVFESSSGNGLYFKDLKKKKSRFVKLIDTYDQEFMPVDHIDGKLYVLTDDGASRYRLVTIDLNNYARENWIEIIPEKEDVLKSVSIVGGKIIARYMKDAHSHIEVFNLQGKYLYEIEIPILGTVSGFSGKIQDKITFYTVTSFTTPSIVYKYDVKNNVSEEYSRSQIDFDPGKYETKQVFYNSKDGTRIPMFLVYKKGLTLNGENPTLLYGYGGFNISLTPRFSITKTILLENGFVFAQANLRGGGEYGEEWHKAGTLMEKQNVFDDFIAAAEYLIDEGYTSPDKLAIQGGSNGGLLVGAVINQRPDLFGVALPAVGVMDMLRYQKFTIGKYWATDYGTSEDNPKMFEYLYHYSPLHNICTKADYPAVLVTTADHDGRVVPAKSFKYIATLQENYQGSRPVLIRIETKAGHGAGMPTSKIIEEYVDLWAFIMYNLDVEPVY